MARSRAKPARRDTRIPAATSTDPDTRGTAGTLAQSAGTRPGGGARGRRDVQVELPTPIVHEDLGAAHDAAAQDRVGQGSLDEGLDRAAHGPSAQGGVPASGGDEDLDG